MGIPIKIDRGLPKNCYKIAGRYFLIRPGTEGVWEWTPNLWDRLKMAWRRIRTTESQLDDR